MKNLAWVQVTDWSSLPKMDAMTNVVHVEEDDVDSFFTQSVYRDFAKFERHI